MRSPDSGITFLAEQPHASPCSTPILTAPRCGHVAGSLLDCPMGQQSHPQLQQGFIAQKRLFARLAVPCLCSACFPRQCGSAFLSIDDGLH